MQTTFARPDFVLFTGDATESGDITANLNVIRSALEARFPGLPVYLVLGNHDFPGSPVGAAAAQWYEHVADTWTNPWLETVARTELAEFGYYSTPRRPFLMWGPQRPAAAARCLSGSSC
jgi:predicted MPP superfamily phosphohydrolase